MWKNIFAFELRFQLRQPLFAASAVAFFALGLALASTDVGASLGAAPAVRNAPIVVLRWMPILSLLGLFVINAFVASGALRDFDHRCEMLFFTKPIGKLHYLGGRFAGAMAASFLVLLAGVVGMVAGNFVPWQTEARLGPIPVSGYLFGLLVILVPNLLSMGAFFFALAIWSRRLALTFLGVVLFIGLQDALEVVADGLDNRVLGSLLEPSGVVALETVARYWTLAEQQARLPELGGVLLANRLLWLALMAVVLATSVTRFDFTTRERSTKKNPGRRRSSKSPMSVPGEVALEHAPEDAPGTPNPAAMPVAPVALPFDKGASGRPASPWRQLLHQARLEVPQAVRSTPFLTLLAFGLMFVAVYGFLAGSHDGLPSYPLTHLMVQAIGLGVRLSLVLILVLYAGELVFDRRALKLDGVYDALPVPNWVFFGAKFLALLAVAGVFLLGSTLTTVSIQLLKGHFSLEPGVYLQGLWVLALLLLPVIGLAIFFQVMSRHKLVGLLATVAVLVLRFALPRLGFENNLLLFGSHPPATYSAFGGYAHRLAPFHWHMAYWGFATLILGVLALLFWQRGIEETARQRLALARSRTTPALLGLALLGLVGMAATGGWIFFNTHLRNEYLDRNTLLGQLAQNEEKYSQYADVPLPSIRAVSSQVDIYPHERRVDIRGRYRLENRGPGAIHVLPITRSSRWVEGVLLVYGGVSLDAVELRDHQVLIEDDELGFYVYELAEALEPGESMDFGFTVSVDHGGFVNRRHNNLVVEDGTFFSNRNFFPTLGYSRNNQILEPNERRKKGLPELERMADLDDASARSRNYLDGDWIEFETILSTHIDQVAVAPGTLQREWEEGGRRYFHYETSLPVVNLIPFLSGRYAVARDRWQDIDIEVYYHPDHGYNIDQFIATTRQSLEYLTQSLGPYPHDQLRILEIPNTHGKLAFSFAQTLPISESWCFTADLSKAGKGGEDLDWLTGILAHEVAHQWWNHQVVPADGQGSTLIAETLPQYAAMMILERMYGPESVRRFLAFHLDRYLERRGSETVREMPLARVENQAYIHYSKGSLALYALKDQIGEAAVNRALRAFLERYAFQGAPWPTSRQLLTYLRREVPEEREGLIEDLFETITLFDNRVVDAGYTEQADGTFRVELTTASRKLREDGEGEAEEIALDDWVDIGIFGSREHDGRQEETVLLMEKHHLQEAESRLEFVVDERPVRVGIDPYNKWVDRDSKDNLLTVEPLTDELLKADER